MPVVAKDLEYRHSAGIWISSGMFSILVMAGHNVLDSRRFFTVLAIAGLAHIVVVAISNTSFSTRLFLSQSLIVLATIAAVNLYLLRNIGLAERAGEVLVDFVIGSMTNLWSYCYFIGYAGIFGVVIVLISFLLSATLSRKRVSTDRTLALLYAASSVNLACEYCFRRPLFHVSGEPGALGFFYAAGLFGLEFALPLHVLILISCFLRHWRCGDLAS
jgi:hypothetical protein